MRGLVAVAMLGVAGCVTSSSGGTGGGAAGGGTGGSAGGDGGGVGGSGGSGCPGNPFIMTMSDSKNCGACGNQCTTGPCSNGACGPLVDGGILYAFNPRGIVVDSTSIYFTDLGNQESSIDVTGTVRKVPLGGGTPVILADKHGSDVSYLFADTDTLYWGDWGAVWKIPKAGGASPTALTTKLPNNGGVVVLGLDATNVYYWVSPIASNPELHKVPKAGGASVMLYRTISSGAIIHRSLAVDATAVHFAFSNSIYKVPIGGGTADAQWFHPQLKPSFLAVIGSTLYFGTTDTGGTGGHIYSIPADKVVLPDGSNVDADTSVAVMMIPGTGDYPERAVTDGTSLFWGNPDGKIMKLAVPAGGTPTQLGTWTPLGGYPWPEVAIDGTRIYWTEWNSPINWQGIRSAAR